MQDRTSREASAAAPSLDTYKVEFPRNAVEGSQEASISFYGEAEIVIVNKSQEDLCEIDLCVWIKLEAREYFCEQNHFIRIMQS